MQRLILFLALAILSINTVFAYEIILPSEKKTISNTNYILFVGHTRKGESITINEDRIFTAPNGAFAHSVKLKDGENRIAIKSAYNTKIYKIYKNKPEMEYKPKLEEFDPVLYTVIKDNTPLRSTPIDFGMNRISHLFEGTKLVIDGEKNGFYRVFLSKNKTGWIAKSAVTKYEGEEEPAKFINMNSETFRNASVHTIEFTDKLPYTIDETKDEIFFKVYNPQVSEDSVYTVTIRKPKKYSYKTISSNGVYVFKVNSLPVPDKALEDMNIFIDPGHGGSELGAIGCLGDKEKDVNLRIATELKNILDLMGANTFMSRECDGFVSLDDRVKMARENCANIFVSIHLNSIPDIKMDIHRNRGTSIYYYNQNSKELAESVLESLTTGINTRDDGARTASFAVIRPTDYVGILVETAYMTNPLDSVMYRDAEFPREAAKAIAEGIVNYVNAYP